MTFTAYIQRQKELIRSRHEGETVLIENGMEIVISESERLLYDLDNMNGLNKRERARAARRYSLVS